MTRTIHYVTPLLRHRGDRACATPGMRGARCLAAAAAVLAAANAALAGETASAPYVRAVVDGSAAEGEVFRVDPMPGVMEKTGSGRLLLPRTSLRGGRAPLRVDVLEGMLSLTEGDTPAFDRSSPPAAMANAVLWLDAGAGIVYDNEGDGTVARWHDRRETKDGDAWGTDFLCANINTANEQTGTPTTVYPVYHEVGSDPAVWFGGFGSGSTMAVYKRDRTGRTEISGIRHLFIVHSITNSIGYIAGTYNNGTAFFQRGSTTYQARSVAAIGVSSGRAFDDGKPIDICSFEPTRGRHLAEWHMGDVAASMGAFFDDRGYSGRAGGDDLCEVVAFTNHLSDAERVAVEEWLYRKWIGDDFHPEALAVRGAKGAEVEVSASTTGTLAQTSFVSVGGRATLVKTGADELSLSLAGSSAFGADSGFSGDVRVDGGTLSLNADEVAYAFEGGDSLVAERDGDKTLVLSKGTATDSGTIVKGGSGTVRIEGIPDGVTNVVVTGGTLVLSAPGVRQMDASNAVSGGAAEVSIPYAGFENLYTAASTSVGSTSTYKQIKDSNWYVFTGSGSFARVFQRSAMPSGDQWICMEDASEGNYAFAIKQTGAFYAEIVVPAAGAYDITFKTCGRAGYAGMTFAVSLEDKADGSVTSVGRCVVSPGVGYLPRLFRTPRIEAGSYKLKFECLTSHDAVSAFDDFKMVRVAEGAEPGVYPVPNGDFERVLPANAETAMNFRSANAVEGWTLNDASETTYLDVGAALFATGKGFFNTYAQNGGSAQLLFAGSAGSAVSDVFTMPGIPSGTYRLRLRCCDWGASYLVSDLNPVYTPKFGATLSINGVDYDLGEVAADDRVLRQRVFPGEVALNGTESLSLTITQKTASNGRSVAYGLVDDLEFVRVPDAGSAELIVNGDFESASGWSFAPNKDTSVPSLKNGRARRFWHFEPNASYIGSDRCSASSEYFLDIGQAGQASRTVVFEKGVHRLSFYVRARPGYGGNRLKVMISRGAATNEIARTLAVRSYVFLKHECVFDVPESGEWTFTLAGVNEDCGNDTWTFVDNVSVKRIEDPGVALFHMPSSPVSFNLSSGASLRLDFTNTIEMASLVINGKHCHQIVDASHRSHAVSGLGAIDVKEQPTGLIITFR